MWQFLAAFAPAIISMLTGGGNNNSGAAGVNSTVAPTADQAALEKAALHRVQMASPLYDSVLKMANGRLPTAYQSHDPLLTGTGGGSTNPTPTSPDQGATSNTKPMPNFAQDIVNSYRGQEGGTQFQTPNTALSPSMSMPEWVDVVGPTGDRKRVPKDQIPAGYRAVPPAGAGNAWMGEGGR